MKRENAHFECTKMGDSMRKNERLIGFDVDAYTARLIGRENVSKLEGAVLELVKNAYDADANTVCLFISRKAEIVFILWTMELVWTKRPCKSIG